MHSGIKKTAFPVIPVVCSAILLGLAVDGDQRLFSTLVTSMVLVLSASVVASASLLVRQEPGPGYAFIRMTFGSITAMTMAQLCVFTWPAAAAAIPDVVARLNVAARMNVALVFALLPAVSRQIAVARARGWAVGALVLSLAASAWPSHALTAALPIEHPLVSASWIIALASAIAHSFIYIAGLVHLSFARVRINPVVLPGMAAAGVCGLLSSLLLAFEVRSPLAEAIGYWLYMLIFLLTYSFILERANAVERSAIRDSLDRYALERKALERRLLRARESEQRRISSMLHDDIGQLMSLLIGTLNPRSDDRQGLEKRISAARLLAIEALGSTRQVARDLHPSLLDDIGLVAALEAYVSTYTAAHGIDADVHVIGPADRRFSPDVESVVYRAVVEALTNVAKHSGASHADVTLNVFGTTLTVVVEDDGLGFDTATPRDGMGLSNIAEQVRLVDGEFSLESRPGAGTTVVLRIPASQWSDGSYDAYR